MYRDWGWFLTSAPGGSGVSAGNVVHRGETPDPDPLCNRHKHRKSFAISA
jgi:hypothetical protein